MSYYFAEFWNTISNLVMILFPIYSLYWTHCQTRIAQSKSTGKDNWTSRKSFYLPKSVTLVQIGLMFVGIGSWMFHMTLLYPMQLLDELPMVYGTAVQVYANQDLIIAVQNFEDASASSNKKCRFFGRVFSNRLIVFGILLAFCINVTFIYLYVWKNPVFHEICYGVLAVIVIVQSFYLISKLNYDRQVYFTGLFYYVLAFVFWNIDNNFCHYLNSMRMYIETVFGLSSNSSYPLIVFVLFVKSFFEFHAFWHIFAGYASYMAIIFLTDLNYKFHLMSTNQNKALYNKRKPVRVKFRCYYYLTRTFFKELD